MDTLTCGTYSHIFYFLPPQFRRTYTPPSYDILCGTKKPNPRDFPLESIVGARSENGWIYWPLHSPWMRLCGQNPRDRAQASSRAGNFVDVWESRHSFQIRQYKNIETIISNLDKKYEVPEHFPYEAIREYFRNPPVTPADQCEVRNEDVGFVLSL